MQAKLGELDSKTDEHLEGLRTKLSSGLQRSGLPLISSVYFLIGLEQLPILAMLVLVYFFSAILSLLLTLVMIIIGVIYLVAYIIIYRFPGMLKGSLGFTLAMLLSICEAIFIGYLCSIVSEVWLIVVISILILDMLLVTGLAKMLKGKYKLLVGVFASLALTVGIYVLYIIFVGGSWTTIIISFIMSIVYLEFLVVIVQRILMKIEIEGEDFKIAIFATLLVYKAKIDYTFGLIFILCKLCAKCCKKKENY